MAGMINEISLLIGFPKVKTQFFKSSFTQFFEKHNTYYSTFKSTDTTFGIRETWFKSLKFDYLKSRVKSLFYLRYFQVEKESFIELWILIEILFGIVLYPLFRSDWYGCQNVSFRLSSTLYHQASRGHCCRLRSNGSRSRRRHCSGNWVLKVPLVV